jgi:hypothetical protein
METPEHERREIEDYLRRESGPDLEIEQVEKLTSEYVLGHQYDVWDAHTNEGRWWVITNPTNLYRQDLIRSMDIALSFHIGLMMRMMGGESRHLANRDRRVRELLRRLDVANESLDRAKEVEDFQAVGMRLRELLLTLTFSLSELIQTSEPTDALQKAGNFKTLANIYVDSIAGGKSSGHLRSLLKATSDKTWEYVSWLTHARNANEQDARIAFSATHEVIETFLGALIRVQRGKPERCARCTSYRLQLVRSEDGRSWVKLCEACGLASTVDVPLTDDRTPEGHEERQAPEGDCTEVEDFGIYLTPSQARSIVENVKAEKVAEGATENVEYQPTWTNPFVYLLFKEGGNLYEGTLIEDGILVDAHRIAFGAFKHPPSAGSELIYPGGNINCCRPQNASELTLPNEPGWQAGIVETAVLHQSFLELQISIVGSGVQRVFVKRDILDRYGFGDASTAAAIR